MSVDGEILVRVTELKRRIGDTVSMRLEAANGTSLPSFDAGAHIDVFISDGLTRQYSLCGDPAENEFYRLGVLRDEASRGGSAAINERIAVGDVLKISAPKNHFPLAEASGYSILIGGGIGITPIISMAYHLQSTGDPFQLHYCVTEASRGAFEEDLAAAPFADKTAVHYDHHDAKPALVPGADIPPPVAGTHIYVCGPTGFMDWIFAEARKLGYSDDCLHKEDFGAEVDVSGEGFQVEAHATGVTIDVEDGQTIVDALSKAGIAVEVSCEEGVCGTCLCDVLEGVPDHRDSFLTDEERDSNEMIMVCCSRSKSSKLVLDV